MLTFNSANIEYLEIAADLARAGQSQVFIFHDHDRLAPFAFNRVCIISGTIVFCCVAPNFDSLLSLHSEKAE